MKEKKLTLRKFKQYLKEHLKEKEYKGLIIYYFDKLDKKYEITKDTEIEAFVYSAQSVYKNDYIAYKIKSINREVVNVVSYDYGFASFYLNALVRIPEEILLQKHYVDSKDDEQLIKEDKAKRKIRRK